VSCVGLWRGVARTRNVRVSLLAAGRPNPEQREEARLVLGGAGSMSAIHILNGTPAPCGGACQGSVTSKDLLRFGAPVGVA
jgi:hypothetical protein